MLRRALIVLGLLYLVVAAALLAFASVIPAVVKYLAVGGTALLAGLVFERQRYRPAVDRSRGPWQLTGERFVDPTTGRFTTVRYNPLTGERDYVESAPGDAELDQPGDD